MDLEYGQESLLRCCSRRSELADIAPRGCETYGSSGRGVDSAISITVV